jgi:hypothetical protein
VPGEPLSRFRAKIIDNWVRPKEHHARRQHVRCQSPTVSILVDEVGADRGWWIDEDLRGDSLEEMLHAPPEGRQMHHVDIEIAVGLSFTANDRSRGDNADRVDFGKDESHGRPQAGREWLREWRPGTLS